MELIIHKHLNLDPIDHFHGRQYIVPIWEIELKGFLLEDINFFNSLNDLKRYKDTYYSDILKRSVYEPFPNDPALELINLDKKNEILDIVGSSIGFQRQYFRPLSSYKEHCYQSNRIILDHPNFEMGVHLDNHSIIVQLIVNLLSDNETSTEFYLINQRDSVYQAPKLKNHGVLFVNTPGALHGIRNITKPRWIWYSSINIQFL